MPFPLIFVIERTLRDAGIPIDGVTVGVLNDRSTWAVSYLPAATAAQRIQGDALLLSLDLSDATVLAEVRADLTSSRMGDEALRAIVQATYEAIQAPANFPTLLSFRNRILTIFRSLI